MVVAFEKINDTESLFTYYVYDDFERQVFTIPPKAVELMETSSWNTSTLTQDLVYRNQYGDKGRLEKQFIPGRDEIYYVYDNLDRLIITQDGNQRNDDLWSFVKYDKLGRIVVNGVAELTVGTGFSD